MVRSHAVSHIATWDFANALVANQGKVKISWNPTLFTVMFQLLSAISRTSPFKCRYRTFSWSSVVMVDSVS